jgi:hypothetical protein
MLTPNSLPTVALAMPAALASSVTLLGAQDAPPTGGSWQVLTVDVTSLGRFDNPRGVALDSESNLYVADSGNARIQRLTLAP